MCGLSFRDVHFVANDPWKHNIPIKVFIINPLLLFFVTEYSWISKITPFSIALWSTEKSWAVPFNEISLSSYFGKSFHTLLKQNSWQGVTMCLKFANLCYQHTNNFPYHCNVNSNVQLILNFFSAVPTL